MLELSLLDTLSPALAQLPERLGQALSEKANILAAALQAKVQQKLSGGVLNARSGALLQAVTTTIDDTGADITVRIAVADDVKYAAIQEFGGVIPPHQIVPDKARALAFLVGGKEAFAVRVSLPAITMPERSYLRSSLAEMAGEIRVEFNAAVAEALD